VDPTFINLGRALESGGLGRIKGGDNVVCGQSAAGDQPRTVAPPGVYQAKNPSILIDHHDGDTARLHCRGDLADVGVIEQARRRPGPGAQVNVVGDGELPDVNLLALDFGVLGMNSMSRMSTTPWLARESSYSKPAAVSRPPGNSIARKSTDPSSSPSVPG
jgi:hypothetical protein